MFARIFTRSPHSLLTRSFHPKKIAFGSPFLDPHFQQMKTVLHQAFKSLNNGVTQKFLDSLLSAETPSKLLAGINIEARRVLKNNPDNELHRLLIKDKPPQLTWVDLEKVVEKLQPASSESQMTVKR